MNDVVWPVGGGDLSQDDIKKNPELSNKVDNGLPPIVQDVQLVRKLHFRAVLATVVTVAALLYMLWTVVCAFGAHLRGSTEFLVAAVGTKPALASDSGNEALPGNFRKAVLTPKDDDGKEAKDGKEKGDAKSTSDQDSKHTSERSHLYAMISSYQTSLSTSSVAVISILVIAIVVITVATLRAALDVKPYDPTRKPEVDVRPVPAEAPKDQGYAFPMVEFLKNLGELITSQFGKK